MMNKHFSLTHEQNGTKQMYFGDHHFSMANDQGAQARRAAFVQSFESKINQKLFTTAVAQPHFGMTKNASSSRSNVAVNAAISAGGNTSSTRSMSAFVSRTPSHRQSKNQRFAGPQMSAAAAGRSVSPIGTSQTPNNKQGKNMFEQFQSTLGDLSKSFGGKQQPEPNMKVNMDGTLSLDRVAVQDMAPKFNA